MKHKLKIHNWKNGKLETEEYFFESIHECKNFLKTIEFQLAKIFDEIGDLIEEISDILDPCPYP